MPLNYELESLDDLITGTLHPKNLFKEKSISDQQFDSWNNLIQLEKQVIRKQLKKMTYSFTKEDHRRLYIQQHQSSITRLKNQVVDFLMPKDASVFIIHNRDTNLEKLYKRCLATLDELMDFIREEFRCYFDEDQNIPINKLLLIQQQIKERLPKIKKYLLKFDYDTTLVTIILETIILQYNNESYHSITYKKCIYLKNLMTALEKVNPDELQSSYYPPLPALLVYLNFNATAFKNYMVKLMHREINAGTCIEDKIEVISFHHKELSQLPVKPGMALIPVAPSVQLDLVTWLFTEMTHLEKKQTLGIVAPFHFKEPSDQDSEKGIYSSLTVEELALFIKAQKETGLIRNKNMKQVSRSIAEYWHSKQKENISWQYLYNSMSTVEATTVNNIESKLMDLVNYLRKMRGGMK